MRVTVPRILAIDAGTTGMTALVVDEEGAVLSKGYREFPQHFPRPGWVEHDPEDWWTGMLAAATDAMSSSGTRRSDVAAIGITNQRETTVLWDRRTLAPVAPAIVWQDRRTAPLCDELRDEGWEERVRERTGLVIDPYFSGTKLSWLLRNVDGAREAAAERTIAFGTVDSYLLARLTAGAVHATDRTNASRTMLFDISALRWDEEILERLEVPPAVLPDVRQSSGVFGTTDPDLFLGIEAPVAGIGGDQQSALFGQACFEPGATKNTYGTGSFVLMNLGDRAAPPPTGLLTTIACTGGDAVQYALEGSIFVTGAAVQWLRDGLGVIERSSDASELAAAVPDAGGVYFVPALTGLGSPWWDPYARGTIIGLTRGTTRAHLVRAAVEAMAYQSRDVVDVMRSGSGTDVTELKVDGGGALNDTLLQLQADLLGVPVRRAAVAETTALGAAYLAGLGAGLWSSTDELAARWRLDRQFEPGDRARAEASYADWRRAVDRARGWVRQL